MLRANNHGQGNVHHLSYPCACVRMRARWGHLRSALSANTWREKGRAAGGYLSAVHSRLGTHSSRVSSDPCRSPASVPCPRPAAHPMPPLTRLDVLSLKDRDQCPRRPSPPARVPITGLCSARPPGLSHASLHLCTSPRGDRDPPAAPALCV